MPFEVDAQRAAEAVVIRPASALECPASLEQNAVSRLRVAEVRAAFVSRAAGGFLHRVPAIGFMPGLSEKVSNAQGTVADTVVGKADGCGKAKFGRHVRRRAAFVERRAPCRRSCHAVLCEAEARLQGFYVHHCPCPLPSRCSRASSARNSTLALISARSLVIRSTLSSTFVTRLVLVCTWQ